jgi:hypothetical protein
MAEPRKKKARTGRPLEKVPLKTLVRRVLKELDHQRQFVPVPIEAKIMKKS